MKRITFLLVALTMLIIQLISCSDNDLTEPKQGLIQGKMVFALETTDDIASGQVTITNGTVTHLLPITITGHTGTVTFTGIQVGHWDITVQLFDENGNEIYSGAGEAIVTRNTTTVVTIQVDSGTGSLKIIVEIPGLVFWSKLGSEAEVVNSEAGPDGQIVGDLDYPPGKHGNGFKPQERTGDKNIPDNFIKYEAMNLGPRGCVEFWFHPDWNTSSVGHVLTLIQYAIPEVLNTSVLEVGYNDWQNRFLFNVRDKGLAQSISYYFVPASTLGWSTSEPFHLAFTWDGMESVSSEKIEMYLNGNAVGILNGFTGSPAFDNWDNDLVLYLASRMNSGDWDRHHWEGSDGVIDNIKIWSYPKTDFSDRFSE